MINLTVDQAFALMPALQELMATKLPVRTSFKVLKFARELDAQMKDYAAKRNVLIMEMGVKQEDGKFVVAEERREEFFTKLKDVVPATLAVNIDQLTVADFGDVSLSPSTLLTMEQNQLIKGMV